MQEAGLKTIETYIACRQNKIAQYIVTGPILELCLTTERLPGAQVPNRWWEQGGLDWEGEREAARAAETTRTETKEAGEEGRRTIMATVAEGNSSI